MFGRYEKHNDATNEHAYYELSLLSDGRVQINWGRIGAKGQMQIVSQSEARTRIQKKTSGKYSFVSNHVQSPVVGANVPVSAKPEEPKQSGFDFNSWLGDD